MSNIQDTAYPRLKSNFSAKDLAAIYTPIHEEQSLAKQVTKGRVVNLGFLILLICFYYDYTLKLVR